MAQRPCKRVLLRMMKNEHLSDGKCFVNITEETGEAGGKEGRILRNR